MEGKRGGEGREREREGERGKEMLFERVQNAKN